MKKVLTICLMMALMLSMSVSAWATNGGFVSSPSGSSAPSVEEFKPSDEECTAQLVITPYGEKEVLSEALQALLEKAYDTVANSDDLTKLNADLAKLAKDKNIPGTNLAVSELFDIHVTGCDYHDGHVDFDIVLDAEMLSRFVGLLHMNKDGQWELVKDAEVVNNGEHLKFSVESFSPFAIVVNTSTGENNNPQTGDDSNIRLYVTIMALSAAAIVVIGIISVKSKKQRT